MPQPLSDDEFSNQFGGGFRAAPSPVGMSGRFGAAVDRTQASLLGIGEAAGLPLGGLRRENQAEADASMQRYYRETGAPRSFSDVSSAGDFGSYVAGLATDSVPAMAGIAAGGLAGGPMGALAVGTALGTGDVLDNQREQAGTTNLASALPLGLAYGATDSLLGVGGMVARRSAGTGIRALDRAGVDMLDGLTGMKGVAARTGATAIKTAGVEAAGETSQEAMNQLGRMSVDDTESFYNERSAENFKESAIGGGLLGGLMGGAAGGWTRSKGYQENEQRDLLAGQEKVQAEQAQTQQYGLQREQARAPVDAALAGFFPEVEQEAAAAQRRKAYMQQFGEAAGAPSGEFVASPVDGLESQLDMGQMFDQRVPPTPEEQIAKAASDASFKAEQEFLQRATTLGVPPKSTPGLKALRMLEDVQGEISPEDYGTLEGKLKAGQFGLVVDALNSREKAFANQAKAQEKAQNDAVKAEQRATEKAQKAATKLAETQAKDAAKEAERAAKAATPPAAEVAPQADTDNAPKAAPAAVAPAEPKSPSIAKLRQKVAAEKAARVTAVVAAAPEVTVSEEKVGGVAVEKVAYVAPAKKAVADEGATKDARASAALVETLLRGNRDAEGDKVAASYEAFKRRLSAVTGFYLDTDEDTGATVLRQDRNPIPMTEVAAAEGVTRAAISKQLNQHGVSDEVVGALAGVESGITEDADTATVDGDGGNETGSDADTMETSDAAAEEEIGGRVSTTAARATGAGQVTGEDFTPGARAIIARAIAKAVELGGNAEAIQTVVAPMQQTIDQAVGVNATEADTEVEDSDGTTAEADDTAYNGDGSVKAAKAAAAKEKKAATLEKKAGLLAEDVRQASRIKSAIIAGVAERMVVKEKPNSKDAPKTAQDLEFEAKRKAAAEESNQRELAFWLRTGDGRHVAQWWDDRANGVGTDFENLPDVDQMRWARGVFNIVTSGTLTDGKFDSLYTTIAGTPTPGTEVQTGKSGSTGAPVEAVGGRRDAPAPVVKKRVVRDAQGRKINQDVLGPDTATAAAINRDVTGPGIPNVAINSDAAQFSKAKKGEGSKSAELESDLKKFMRVGAFGNKVTVVQSMADLPAGIQRSVNPTADTQGFVVGNKAYLIADNIAPGKGRAVFLHEIGAHLGLENLMGKEQYAALVSKVKQWAAKADGSQESKLAQAAQQRVADAGTDATQADSELVAYFIEEAVDAGIDPTATKGDTEFGRWFRTIWAAFKTAMHKLGVNPDKLTAQDVVDMAYGAAKLEATGTFHGTAGEFRKFDHKYMGSGEGAQAFGWGSYFAQDDGIAKGYFRTDVRNKTQPGGVHGRKVTFDGTTYTTLELRDLAKEIQRSGDIGADFWKYASLRSVARQGFDATLADLKIALKGNPGYPPHIAQIEWLEANKARISTPTAPEGSLMRVDFNVADDEWLDLDKTLSEQSEKVQTAITKILGARFLEGTEGANGRKLYDWVGERQDADAFGEGDKGASGLLDSFGIKGNKFLDANSRGTRGATLFIDGQEVYAMTSMSYGEKDGIVRLKRNNGDVAASLREAEAEALGTPEEVAYLKSLVGKDVRVDRPDKNSNFVVFNDKNIQRVSSMKAADRNRVSFSKAAKPMPKPLSDTAQRLAGRTGNLLVSEAMNGAKKLGYSMLSLHDLVAEFKTKLPAAQEWYNGVQASVATRNKLEALAETIAADAEKLPGTGKQKVSAFLASSTTTQKWGYDPKIAGKTVTVDPATEAEFKKLNQQERKVVQDVFQHGENMRVAQADLLKKLGVGAMFKGVGQLDGPYAPLKRFGNYVALLKSQKMLDLMETGTAAEVDKLKQDPKHYRVSYFDTHGQAKAFARENDAANGGTFAFTDNFEKSVRVDEQRPLNAEVLQKVLAAVGIKEGLPAEAKEAVTRLVNDMYLQSIDEHSARTSGEHRFGRAGFDEDMIRSFLSHARAQAGFLANMEHGVDINGAFYSMQRQAKNEATGKRVGQDAFNLFAAHYAENLKRQDTPWQDRAMALTSAWQLATSVGYHVTNATQGMMVTVPKLAADFNDYSGAWRHLMAGYKQLAAGGMWGNFDLAKVKNSGLRAALQRASDAGLLDVGMDENLTQFDALRTGIAGVDTSTKVARAALHKLRKVSKTVELANRVAALTAAYNMAVEYGQTQAQAQEYAVSAVQSTQGDFNFSNKPLLLKRLPKVMGQYRSYQFMMGALYVKAFRQAVWGSVEEKAIGRRMLGYKLFHASMAAGALGVPMMNLAALAFSALGGDDDEPADLERSLREKIGDETLANLLLHGPLAYLGLDMSSKLGEDKIFSIAPYGKFDLTSKKGLYETVAGVMGPSTALAGQFADATGKLKDGDYYKGLEGFMPKGISQAMKASRIANEGFTLSNGDVMFKSDDINGFALALDALGLPSSELKRMSWIRSQQYEIGQFYKDRSSEIQREYAQEVKSGGDGLSELRQQWLDLQDGKRGMRKYFGDSQDALKHQPITTLLKYPASAAKREQKLQATVPQ